MIGLLNKPLSIRHSGWKETQNGPSGNSLSPLRAQNKDIGAASQMLLTGVISAMQAITLWAEATFLLC